MKYFGLVVLMSLLLGACSAEIGSDAWCKELKEKNKGDWTARELKDFAKHCVFN